MWRIVVLAGVGILTLGGAARPATHGASAKVPPYSDVVVTQGAPRAGKVFVGAVLVVPSSFVDRFSRYDFDCVARVVTNGRASSLLRAAYQNAQEPVPRVVVCAWHVPPGTKGKKLVASWAWQVDERVGDRIVGTGGGTGESWKIQP